MRDTRFCAGKTGLSRTLPYILQRWGAIEGRIGPSGWGVCQAMPHRICAAKLHMGGVVFGGPQMVFPKPPLPNATLLPRDVACAQRPLRQARRKPRFDQPPARCKIAIAGRQRPDRVQMIGQDHPRLYDKPAFGAGCAHRLAQAFNFPHQQIIAARRKGNCKKDRLGCGFGADIIRHRRIFAQQG